MPTNTWIPKKDMPFFKVHYYKDQKDTAPCWYIAEVLSTLYSALKVYVGDKFYKGFELHVWSRYREDAPDKLTTFKGNKVHINTKYLQALDKDGAWSKIISQVVAHRLARFIGFENKDFIYKEWQRIRVNKGEPFSYPDTRLKGACFALETLQVDT